MAQVEELNFEKNLMPVENIVAIGFMIHSAVRVKEMLDLGLMTPFGWVLAAIPFIAHVVAYNFLKKSATDRGVVAENKSGSKAVNYLLKPFIGPVLNRLRLTNRS